MELRQLDRDVYVCEQEDRGLGWSNSGFIFRGGGFVIDTLYDVTLTRQMVDLYASVHPSPAQRLVNTHHNGDHCWGNQLFDGADIIAHRGWCRTLRRFLAGAGRGHPHDGRSTRASPRPGA